MGSNSRVPHPSSLAPARSSNDTFGIPNSNAPYVIIVHLSEKNMRTFQPASRCGSRPVWAVLFIVLVYMAAGISLSAQTLTTLVTFEGSNGIEPWALVQGNDGNVYGITQAGGNLSACGGSGCGEVFKMTSNGVLTVIYTFSGPDGQNPEALVQGTDGNFYGTTFCTPGNGAEQSHHTLRPDGSRHRTSGPPLVGLCTGPGTIFKLSPSGSLTTLASVPTGGRLIQASDGNFYGTTPTGGPNLVGAIFKMTPTGTLTTLYSFAGPDGAFPYGFVQGSDGNFYGVTFGNGTDNQGTVYKITPSGTLTTLHAFSGLDGARPYGGMVQATDGNFYGTTDGGGTHNGCFNNDCGTVFKITPTGVLTTLYNFTGGSDGNSPHAGLIQATDGNIYGTTNEGGLQDFAGTVFRMTLSGNLATLYNFCSQPGCADGEGPEGGPLLEAGNGLLYGTTYYGGDSGDGTVFTLAAVNPSPSQFVPVTECRLVDTRQAGSPIVGGTWQVFTVPQLGGCNIPANATSYSLNLTVVPQGPLGYVTMWPTGQPQPYVSTMNSLDGRTKANAAIVPAGASGAVSVYATNTTDVILDIDGYFEPSTPQTLQFYPLTPCRVVDTRQTNFPAGLGAPSFGNMETRELPVYTNSPCLNQVTVTPSAYSFNVTVVPNPSGQSLNFLTIWPSNDPIPEVSTLNNPTATVVANAAVVQSDPSTGDVDVFTYNSTDVIIDVNGYFAPGPGGYNLYPTVPCRAYDSRNNNGQPFMGERTAPIATSPCAPPANAAAYVFNATVVPSGVMPYLTLWADGSMGGQPMVSTLNAYDGYITSNMAIVPNVNGNIDAYAAGLTQLILDISGYFAP